MRVPESLWKLLQAFNPPWAIFSILGYMGPIML